MQQELVKKRAKCTWKIRKYKKYKDNSPLIRHPKKLLEFRRQKWSFLKSLISRSDFNGTYVKVPVQKVFDVQLKQLVEVENVEEENEFLLSEHNSINFGMFHLINDLQLDRSRISLAPKLSARCSALYFVNSGKDLIKKYIKCFFNLYLGKKYSKKRIFFLVYIHLFIKCFKRLFTDISANSLFYSLLFYSRIFDSNKKRLKVKKSTEALKILNKFVLFCKNFAAKRKIAQKNISIVKKVLSRKKAFKNEICVSFYKLLSNLSYSYLDFKIEKEKNEVFVKPFLKSSVKFSIKDLKDLFLGNIKSLITFSIRKRIIFGKKSIAFRQRIMQNERLRSFNSLLKLFLNYTFADQYTILHYFKDELSVVEDDENLNIQQQSTFKDDKNIDKHKIGTKAHENVEALKNIVKINDDVIAAMFAKQACFYDKKRINKFSSCLFNINKVKKKTKKRLFSKFFRKKSFNPTKVDINKYIGKKPKVNEDFDEDGEKLEFKPSFSDSSKYITYLGDSENFAELKFYKRYNLYKLASMLDFYPQRNRYWHQKLNKKISKQMVIFTAKSYFINYYEIPYLVSTLKFCKTNYDAEQMLCYNRVKFLLDSMNRKSLTSTTNLSKGDIIEIIDHKLSIPVNDIWEERYSYLIHLEFEDYSQCFNIVKSTDEFSDNDLRLLNPVRSNVSYNFLMMRR